MADNPQLKVDYTEFVDIPANLLVTVTQPVKRLVEDPDTGLAAGVVVWDFVTDNSNLELWIHKPLNSVNPEIIYGPFEEKDYLILTNEGYTDVMFYFYDRSINVYGVIIAALRVYDPRP